MTAPLALAAVTAPLVDTTKARTPLGDAVSVGPQLSYLAAMRRLRDACGPYGDLRICSGELPSFDGSPLDADVTVPRGPRPRGGYPLAVMIHGAGGVVSDKREFESVDDTADGSEHYHWNSHWFATHGFYVLTFTQRGYRTQAPSKRYAPRTATGSSASLPNGTIHLTSVEFSIRDTEWFTALVAAAFPIDPHRIVVTGRSSGGGESWLLASQGDITFPHQQDSSLPVLHVAAAVPRTAWTDLAYSFLPNGHGGGPTRADIYESSEGRPDSESGAGGPAGAPKQSFLTGVYALVNKQGILETGTTTTPSREGPTNLHAWFARSLLGDPYADSGFATIRRGLTVFRSAYYQTRAWLRQLRTRKVPIFAIQGWTDDLFTAVEAFREFTYLKRLDRSWPITLELADVGDAHAQNKPAVWRRLNADAWAWLSPLLRRSERPRADPAVRSYPTSCVGSPGPGMALAGSSPAGLARGGVVVHFRRGGTLTASATADPNGPASDPVAGGGTTTLSGRGGSCLSSLGPALGAFSAESQPLATAATYVGLGEVTVRYRLIGARAQLAARLWDVTPARGSKPMLVTRGVYVLDGDPASGTIALPLFGNHWRLGAGHRLRLDLTEVDAPFLRPADEPSVVRFDAPTLRLPTADPGERNLVGR